MDNDYSIIAANDRETLLRHREAILDLFSLCFGREMDPALWEWAYQRNPCGDARVHLAYAETALTGHYAMIPQRYREGHRQLTLALSMTTMVHPKHRRAGLFNRLAEACYAEATHDGVQAVLGFPNNKSAPGFRKRLQWRCHDDYRMVKTSVEDVESTSPCRVIDYTEFMQRFRDTCDRLMLDLGEEKLLAWRLSKPGVEYTLLADDADGLFIVKIHEDALDVVFSSVPDPVNQLGPFARSHGCTALVCFEDADRGPHLCEQETIQYRFGYRPLQQTDVTFRPQLIMSDVF